MSRPPEYSGSRFVIECLVLPGGSCPAGEFLDALPKQDRRKLDVLFSIFGDRGYIHNAEKFKKLSGSDGIFEFKSFQVRLFCCHCSSKRLILLYGLMKKKDKHSKTDILRAEAYKSIYESQE